MKYLLFITALTITIAACDKPGDDPETIYLPSSFDDYVLFPEGSWWVYEEENTGERDTVTVIELNRFIPEHENLLPNEEAHATMTSTYYETEIQFNSKVDSDKNGRTTYYGPGGGGQFYVYTTEVGHGEYIPSGSYMRYTYHEYDSLKIGNMYYYDIREVENHKDVPGGVDCNEDFTNAKGIGVVQHTTCNDHKTWNLIDYYINE